MADQWLLECCYFHGTGILTCFRTFFSFFSISNAECGDSAWLELFADWQIKPASRCFFGKWNLSSQTGQGASYLADQWNGNSIRVDIVFYYSPGQSSGPFICKFKLFTLSFVNPEDWLRAWARLLQASVWFVMYGAMIGMCVQKIWISVHDVNLNVQCLTGGLNIDGWDVAIFFPLLFFLLKLMIGAYVIGRVR